MPLIRSISGLRATLDDCLDENVIKEYCSAFAEVIPEGDIVIGRDGRPSGKWIEEIVARSLADSGRNVIVLGIVPTPTVQLLTEKNSCAAGGIAITASHNPSQWNGLKFINTNGIFLNADENAALWDVVDNNKFQNNSTNKCEVRYDSSAREKHISAIMNLSVFQDSDILKKIKHRKLCAVVDAVNASGSVIVPLLLEQFGCKVIKLFCDETGEFPHTPEPLPENLTELAKSVKLNNADLGIAVDPDADRLVLIDENGEPIGEERTIVLAVMACFMQKNMNERNSIVVNHSTTRTVEDIAEMYGAVVHRSPVGEINVIGKMKEYGSVIGGEGSGGVILPECHYGRDSLVGIALTLALIAESGKTLSEICNELPKYEMIKTKRNFTGDISSIIERIKIEFANDTVIHEDGIKIISDKSWVQLRASNTEPIIRIIAEAPEKSIALNMIDRVNTLI